MFQVEMTVKDTTIFMTSSIKYCPTKKKHHNTGTFAIDFVSDKNFI